MADELGGFLDSPDLALYITGSPEKVTTGASPSRSYAFCTPSNIDKCVSYVNQELSGLGFLPLTCMKADGQSEIDGVRLLNCVYELLQQHRQDLQQSEDLQCRLTRADSDLGAVRLSQTRLKEEYDQRRRHLVAAEERERQAVLTVKTLSDELRLVRDELRRARIDHQHRTSQFLHESRKSEREINRLKDRLSNAHASDRLRDRLGGIALLNKLPRADGRRSSWVKGQGLEDEIQPSASSFPRHEDTLYQTVLANYEARQKELMVENIELRNILSWLAATNRQHISSLVARQDAEQFAPVTSPSPIPDDSREAEMTPELSLSFNEGMTQLPLESVRQGLRDSMRQHWRLLKSHISHLESGQTATSTPARVRQEVLRRTIKEQRFLLEQQEKLLKEKAAENQVPAALLNVSHLAHLQDRLAAQHALLEKEKKHVIAEREGLLQLAHQLDQESSGAPMKLSRQSEVAVLAAEFLNSSIFQSSPFKSPPAQVLHTPKKVLSSNAAKSSSSFFSPSASAAAASPLLSSSPRFSSPPRRTAAPRYNPLNSPKSQLLKNEKISSGCEPCLSSTPLTTQGHLVQGSLTNSLQSFPSSTFPQPSFTQPSGSSSFIFSPIGSK